MNSKVISEVVYFWMFMLGVLLFGKLFGAMRDTRSMALIMIGAAIIYVVWRVFRAKGKAKRAAREFEQTRQQIPQKKRKILSPSTVSVRAWFRHMRSGCH